MHSSVAPEPIGCDSFVLLGGIRIALYTPQLHLGGCLLVTGLQAKRVIRRVVDRQSEFRWIRFKIFSLELVTV